VSPVVVYYNEDLVDLSQLGEEGEEPPTAIDGWDWEVFVRAARQASRGPADGLYLEPGLFSLAPFVWSAGGDIVDDPQAPTTLTLADGEAREALEQVLALVRDPEVTPSRSELQRQDAVTRFARGELGMILGTRALTPRLREAEGLNFDVMPLPSLGRVRTIADMSGYCLAADTEHVQAAGDFLAFAVGREGAAITTRPGYVVPSNLEVANSPAFNQQPEQPESSFVFNEGVRRAESLPFVPTWPELDERVQPAFSRMFYAPVIDLETLLEEIDTTSQEVLAPAEE
jgi:multiple sugar transport system substrate-binding protein